MNEIRLIECPECGKEIAEGSEKCIYCGHALTKNENTAEPKEAAEEKVEAAVPEEEHTPDSEEETAENAEKEPEKKTELDGLPETEEDLNSIKTEQEDNAEDKPAAPIEMEKKKESRIKKALHPLLKWIHKKTPDKFKSVRPIYILTAFVLIIAIAAGGIVYTVQKNSFTADEKSALKCVEKLKGMMKDPSSFTLTGNLVVIDGEDKDGKTSKYIYIPSSGTNSYGGRVSNTEIFVRGSYLCNLSEVTDFEMGDDEYFPALYAAMHYLGWTTYGEDYPKEAGKSKIVVLSADEVSAKKIARKLHVKVEMSE